MSSTIASTATSRTSLTTIAPGLMVALFAALVKSLVTLPIEYVYALAVFYRNVKYLVLHNNKFNLAAKKKSTAATTQEEEVSTKKPSTATKSDTSIFTSKLAFCIKTIVQVLLATFFITIYIPYRLVLSWSNYWAKIEGKIKPLSRTQASWVTQMRDNGIANAHKIKELQNQQYHDNTGRVGKTVSERLEATDPLPMYVIENCQTLFTRIVDLLLPGAYAFTIENFIVVMPPYRLVSSLVTSTTTTTTTETTTVNTNNTTRKTKLMDINFEKEMISHESVHCVQYLEHGGPLPFLSEYFAAMVANIVVSRGDLKRSYYNNPYEIEAYALELRS